MNQSTRSTRRSIMAVVALLLLSLSLTACAANPVSSPGVYEVKNGLVKLPAGEVAVIDQYTSKHHKYWRFTYDGQQTVYMDKRDEGWPDGPEHHQIYVPPGKTIKPDLGWGVSSVKISIGNDGAAYIKYDTGWLSSWTYHPSFER